jgi:competence ComEA-like helix-hairpin-helix protein
VVLFFVPHKPKPVLPDEETADAAALLERKSHSNRSKSKRQYRNFTQYGRQTARNIQSESAGSNFLPPDFMKNRQERAAVVVDLNSADTLDLQDIRGIGPYFARAIVKYRDLLGGYVNKEQLREVYGMTTDRYEAIAPHIVLEKADIRKMKINAATYSELRRHPYIDNATAKAIVRLRNAGEQFHNAADLLKISIIDNETILKLTPYMDFGTPEDSQNPTIPNDTVHSGPDGPNA